MSNLSSLKKNSSLQKLARALESTTKNSSGKDDERFWQPEVDAAGNGYAVIRFLDAPAVDGEDAMPWVQVFSHGFQGPGGWYIENSLTTLGQKDPVSEYNTQLWNSGIEANKEVARKQKRRLTYISNVLVIKDTANSANEGKVFLYKYGKKIFDKIKEKIEPQFEDEKAINPFNFWEGANFKLKIRKVEGYRNYDKSEFENPSALFDGDDAEIEKLWKSEHSLKDFLDAKHFKSYDELKTKLDRVLGLDGVAATRAKAKAEDLELADEDSGISLTENEDDDMAFFEKLAAD
jgi:hypothetical protein